MIERGVIASIDDGDLVSVPFGLGCAELHALVTIAAGFDAAVGVVDEGVDGARVDAVEARLILNGDDVLLAVVAAIPAVEAAFESSFICAIAFHAVFNCKGLDLDVQVYAQTFETPNANQRVVESAKAETMSCVCTRSSCVSCRIRGLRLFWQRA